MTEFFRLHKNIFVDISLITAAALSIIFGKINLFIILFSVAIHELGHILAALLIGARAENFVIHGFGVELIFHGKSLNPKQTLKLAAGGPVASFILAFLAKIFGNPMLYLTNLSIALLNLLPANPLDGGNIFIGLLSGHIPRTKLRKIIKLSGKFFGFSLTACGILILFISGFNISLIYLGLFIFFSADRLHNPVTEITSADYSKTEKSTLFLLDSSVTLLEAASRLPINSVGAVKDKNGNISSFVTPLQLYELAISQNLSPDTSLKNIKTSTP